MNDRIKIKGYVNVYQHEGEFDKSKKLEKNKVVGPCSNKFVDNALGYLRAAIAIDKISSDVDTGTYDWDMYLGTDTGTATTSGMTELQSSIGTLPGTAPGAKSGSDSTEVSGGNWEARYICTWYSGTVSGTVGEIGLYITVVAEGYAFGETGYAVTSKDMVNRLSVADGEFTSFTIDTTKSLTVEWVLRYEFE